VARPGVRVFSALGGLPKCFVITGSVGPAGGELFASAMDRSPGLRIAGSMIFSQQGQRLGWNNSGLLPMTT
jgi:hypothetical protein